MVGITAAQSARNTLAAGVPVSYNSAQFLGHLPGRRGARGPVETGPAPLLLIDEASTMPGPDLADLIAYAQARDGKVILAGDTSQLQAVENGGGMSLLADALGYARLAEPVRFRAAWEQHASLRLRDGDITVLAEYSAAEDVDHLAAAMDPGSTAGVLIWENLWAAPFAAAARRSGGQLIANGRIPIQAIIASIEADQAATTEGD